MIWKKYCIIAGLYLAQGLPGGLMAYTLPTLFREQNISLAMISLLSFFAFPWSIKLLWSGLLDQSANKHRWFISSLLLGLSCWLLLSCFSLSYWLENFVWLFLSILLAANFVMASQDILTDGLVVRFLNEQDRGLANSLQVLAYKLGMMIGGALFLYLYSQHTWQFSMRTLVLVLCIAYLPYLLLYYCGKASSIHRYLTTQPTIVSPAGRVSKQKKLQLRFALSGYLKQEGVKYWLLVLASFKLADGLISTLTRPFWFDYGVSIDVIAKASAIGITLGMLMAVLAGWLWRFSFKRDYSVRDLLLAFACLQALSIAGYYYLSNTQDQMLLWWFVVLFEQAMDVMSTVIIFASMMSACRKAFAGIDYTFQATVLLVLSGALHLVAGLLADYLGYAAVFAIALLLTLPVIALLWFANQRLVPLITTRTEKVQM